MPFHFGLAHWNAAGVSAARSELYILERITACGHTITHLPHWMQRSLSHTGMNCAMLRFSHCAVPVGNAPPAGIALTGSRSPCPAAICPSTLRTNSGALLDIDGIRSNSDRKIVL